MESVSVFVVQEQHKSYKRKKMTSPRNEFPFHRISQTRDPDVVFSSSSSSSTIGLKKLLILRGKEPPHFFTCICEKFNGFVRNPELFKWHNKEFQPYQPDDSFALLSCVDAMDQADLTQEHIRIFRFYFDYDFVVFPLYAGCDVPSHIEPLLNDILNMMKELISSKRIAVLFLRGGREYSVPCRLGYVKDVKQGFVEYAFQYMDINVTALNETCLKSALLMEFKTKYPELFIQHEKIQQSVDLSQSYICAVLAEACTDLSKWNILATAEEGKKLSLLLHKTERVMFTPWYGFNHGNELSHDIVRYFCKYLVLEYLREDDSNFKMKLTQKYQNVQLCDTAVVTMQ